MPPRVVIRTDPSNEDLTAAIRFLGLLRPETIHYMWASYPLASTLDSRPFVPHGCENLRRKTRQMQSPRPTGLAGRIGPKVNRNLLTNAGVLLGLTAMIGCSDALIVNVAPPSQPKPTDTAPGVYTHLLEDFDNQLLVHSVTGAAQVHVNQGIATLPVESFPRLEGGGLDMYRGDFDHNGLVEAESIVISQTANFEASDAVELRAQDTVHISGTLRAGRGGVTLVAGRQVIIDGAIESRGPVHILVEDPDGEVRISGRITVHASADDPNDMPPNLEILGRSAVTVSGQIISTAGPRRQGGDIQVRVYGGIKVVGLDARIATMADEEGIAGDLRLRSEADITIADGAGLGRLAEAFELGGDIEVQGQTVRIEAGARVLAGDGMLKGGSVFLTAANTLAITDMAQVGSGAGPEGGSLIVKAALIGVGEGAIVQGGQGRSYGAHFTIDAVTRLDVAGGAVIQGGSTSCGPGGAVQIAVGGTVRVRAGAALQGGHGAVDFGNRVCTTTAKGGDVKVQAWDGDGVAEASFPGRGFPDGEVLLEWDEDLTVLPPNLTVGTYGQILSKIVDRGDYSSGHEPRLVGWDANVPDGASISIDLCGADLVEGPYDTCAPADDPEALQAFSDTRFFRYRVRLVGRTYDAPSLDYFEIDLAPVD